MLETEVLNHATRKRIYLHIVDNPGITFAMLRRTFGINDGTLNYHLNFLRKGDLIEIRKRKNERIYLPTDGSDPSVRDLKNEQKLILSFIWSHQGSGISEIVRGSGIAKKDVTRIVACLRKKHLIRGQRQGKDYVYHPITEADLRNEVMLLLIDKYTRGEIPLNRLLELKRKLIDDNK